MSLDCFLEGFIYLQDHYRIRNSNNLRYWNEKTTHWKIYSYLLMCACMYMHMCTHGGWKRALCLLELECFWNIWFINMGGGIWGSHSYPARTLNHCAVSPAPPRPIKKIFLEKLFIRTWWYNCNFSTREAEIRILTQVQGQPALK